MQMVALLASSKHMNDAVMDTTCLRLLQTIVVSVAYSRDAGAAHDVSDKVLYWSKQKLRTKHMRFNFSMPQTLKNTNRN